MSEFSMPRLPDGYYFSVKDRDIYGFSIAIRRKVLGIFFETAVIRSCYDTPADIRREASNATRALLEMLEQTERRRLVSGRYLPGQEIPDLPQFLREIEAQDVTRDRRRRR